jgi:2',3'-cyclic-nucleotide 2'-phosphodiesterase (5'-nucleotidase family)
VLDAGDFGELDSARIPGGWKVTSYLASILGQIGLDAWTPGERELLHGPERVAEILKATGGFGVSANVRAASGERPFKTDHVFTAGSLRVGVTGVTGSGALLAPRRADHLQESVAKWRVDEPLSALQPVLRELRKRADVVVLLAHLSIEEARPLVEQLDDVDVVILGHNPATGFGGERWGRATVLRTGHKGTTVPMLSLMVERDSVRVVDTFYKVLSPGDPYLADLHTKIALFEQELSSFRQKAQEEDRRNRTGRGAAAPAADSREQSESDDR